VLLGIDEVDIEGKHLQEIKYIILCKTNTTVQLTFLNKHWFNNQIKKSAKVRDTRKLSKLNTELLKTI
jgi:hypothetical protein